MEKTPSNDLPVTKDLDNKDEDHDGVSEESVATQPQMGGRELIQIMNSFRHMTMSSQASKKSKANYTTYQRQSAAGHGGRRRHRAERQTADNAAAGEVQVVETTGDQKAWRGTGAVKKWQDLRRLMTSSKSMFKSGRTVKKVKKVNLRPSKLTFVVCQTKTMASALPTTTAKSAESRFSDFSAACCKELETIEVNSSSSSNSGGDGGAKRKVKKVASSKKSAETKTEETTKKPRTRAQKRRKTSTCAQQARSSECYNHDVNLSIDMLADYLEESILLPKKMSYMAELMYT